jgi:hypothetical protein
MILQKMFSTVLAISFALAPQASKQELNDQMFEAVRKGDATAVASLLDKGADVNARFRYGMTALFKAAEKGNPAVVKLLLDRGVDVNVKDTFYSATAMTWAMSNKHIEVIKLLLDKLPAEVENVLLSGAREGELSLVQAALEKGGAKPETLTQALAAASDDPKNAAIVDALKKAGAIAPPVVELATLQSYVGKYKGEPGPELNFVVKDGKFYGSSPNGGQFPLMAVDNTNFKPTSFSGLHFTFNVEGGKVVGLTFKQGPNTTQLKRVEDPKP